MAPPRKPESARKTPYAVSLSRAEREVFQYLGGSAYLQGHLLAAARRIVDVSTPKHPARQAAQDVINANAGRELEKFAKAVEKARRA